MERPCPSCSAFIDGLDGSAEHVEQRANVVVIAEYPLLHLLDTDKERGWRHLRFHIQRRNAIQSDDHGVADNGDQMPILNVFHRHNGTIDHFWSSKRMGAPADPGQDWRQTGTFDLLWNLFDITSGGSLTNEEPYYTPEEEAEIEQYAQSRDW